LIVINITTVRAQQAMHPRVDARIAFFLFLTMFTQIDRICSPLVIDTRLRGRIGELAKEARATPRLYGALLLTRCLHRVERLPTDASRAHLCLVRVLLCSDAAF
jgi:hypothetical protein